MSDTCTSPTSPPQYLQRFSKTILWTMPPTEMVRNSASKKVFVILNATSHFKESAADFVDRQCRVQQQRFDALLLCNLIFRKDKVLLMSSRQCTQTGKLLVYVPHTRIYGAEDDAVPDSCGFTYIRRVIDDASLADFAHAAIATQTGLDPKELARCPAEIACTAITPDVYHDGERRLLRATVQWESEASSSHDQLDNRARSQVFWACEDEVEDIPDTSFAPNMKDAILDGFEIRRKASRVDSAWPEDEEATSQPTLIESATSLH